MATSPITDSESEYFIVNVDITTLYLNCGLLHVENEVYITLFHASHTWYDHKKGLCKKDKIATLMQRYYYGKVEFRNAFRLDAEKNGVKVIDISIPVSKPENTSLDAYPITWLTKKIQDIDNPYSNQSALFKEVFCEPIMYLVEHKHNKLFDERFKKYIVDLTNILSEHPENFAVLASCLLPPIIQNLYHQAYNKNRDYFDQYLDQLSVNEEYESRLKLDLKDVIKLFKIINLIDDTTEIMLQNLRKKRNDIFHNNFPLNNDEDFSLFIANSNKITGFFDNIIRKFIK